MYRRGSNREIIPLIPAIRPFVIKNITADKPISIPPIKELNGVNSVSIQNFLIKYKKLIKYIPIIYVIFCF